MDTRQTRQTIVKEWLFLLRDSCGFKNEKGDQIMYVCVSFFLCSHKTIKSN